MAASIAARREFPCRAGYMPPPPPPPPRRRSWRSEPGAARAPRPPPVPTVSAACASSISAISRIRSKWPPCRAAAARTPTRWCIDPKDKENVYIYISGTGSVRQPEELAGCSGGDPDDNPEYRAVPHRHHQGAAGASGAGEDRRQPAHLHRQQTGAINGLWKGGNHGEGTQNTSVTDKCHDITVYSAMGLAAGACSGNGILLDISNPAHPVRIDAVSDPNYAFWHSANFNNAGTKVAVHRRMGRRRQPRCRATDPMNWGADAIFTLSKGKLTLASYYKMPAPQTENENCVAHNGSLVPIPGRDILVQAWYQGGISVVDFTDAAHPIEIAYFDRGPVDARQARDWAGSGRPTGTTATSMVRRSRAAWTCSSWCRTSTSRRTKSTPPIRCTSTS